MTGQTGSVAWVVITTDDLYSRLVAGQLDALRNSALGTLMNNPQTGAAQTGGTDDVFNTIMPDTVARIRQYIASNPRNQLSETDNSIPPECKWMTVWLVLQDMVGRLSIAMPLNDDQKRQIDAANKDMDRLRSIQPPWLAVSTPIDPEPDPSIGVGVPATVISANRRQLTRHSLRAL